MSISAAVAKRISSCVSGGENIAKHLARGQPEPRTPEDTSNIVTEDDLWLGFRGDARGGLLPPAMSANAITMHSVCSSSA